MPTRSRFFQQINTLIRNNPKLALSVVFVLSRLVIGLIYGHVTLYSDSADYIGMADRMLSLDPAQHNGERTPLYPLFLLVGLLEFPLIIVLQMFLGLCSCLMLYDILVSFQKRIAFIATAFVSLLPHVIFYEFAILTETLTLFLLTLLFWYIHRKGVLYLNTLHKAHLWTSLILIVLFFTRPFFIYVAFLLGAFFFLNALKKSIKQRLKILLVTTMPILLAFFAWGKFNEKTTGEFGSTIFLGYNLAQTSIDFFDEAGDEHAHVRDIYIRYRDSLTLHDHADRYRSIWAARPELKERTGLNDAELGGLLKEISTGLIIAHPLPYVRQIGISWFDFWKYSIAWHTECFRSPLVKKLMLGLVVYIERPFMVVLSIIFLVACIRNLFLIMRRKEHFFSYANLVMLTILLGSSLQAMVTYGENARFRFPYLYLMVYFIVYNLTKTNSLHGESYPKS